MAAYTSILQVPEWVPANQRKDYEGFLQMKQETEGQRRELGLAKMDTLQELLGKVPGLTDMYSKTTNLVQSMLAGEVSKPMQQILQQQGAALSAQHGVGGSQAGANITLAGLGKESVRMQQQGLLQVPQILNSLKTTFMGNIADSQDIQGPSWGQWQASELGERENQYQAQLAQAKARLQVAQLNEQYAVQEAQREAAHARMMQSQATQQAFQARESAANRSMQAALSAQAIQSQVAFDNAARFQSQMAYIDNRNATRAQRMYQSSFARQQQGNLWRASTQSGGFTFSGASGADVARFRTQAGGWAQPAAAPSGSVHPQSTMTRGMAIRNR